jgi:hypothetical protein
MDPPYNVVLIVGPWMFDVEDENVKFDKVC